MELKYDKILGELRENDDPGITDATTTQKGIVQLATIEETIAGENDTKAVTPRGARDLAWVSASQGNIYGVLYDPASSSPICQRVILNGRQLTAVDAFAEMPAHAWRRCVMDDLAQRHINYYLDAHDSTLKTDGTAADLTGTDGDVMVEIPVTYWKCEVRPDGKILYLISNTEFVGSSVHPFFYVSPDGKTIRTQYVGAYQSTLCDTTGARIANMTNQDFETSSTYVDGYKARSVAGCKPWASLLYSTFNVAANNNGGTCANALFYQYLALMMLIEGGSFNTQETISYGFSYADYWYYKYTRLSGRANFGNGTGSILCDPEQDANIIWRYDASEAQKVVQFAYRGIENPYGEMWALTDGIQIKNNSDPLDSGYYQTAATSLYTSPQAYMVTPTYMRVNYVWPHETGVPLTWRPDNFLPLTIGGDSTTYLCDYYVPPSSSSIYLLLYGGALDASWRAGAYYIYPNTSFSRSFNKINGRLAA